jgi:hypothetical protein
MLSRPVDTRLFKKSVTDRPYCSLKEYQELRKTFDNYILSVEESFMRVFMEVSPDGGINPFFHQKLVESRLPLCIYDKILSIINSKLTRMLDTEGHNSTLEDSLKAKKQVPETEVSQNLRQIFNKITYRVKALFIGVLDSLYIICARIPKEKTVQIWTDRYYIFSMNDELEDKYKFHTNYLACSLHPDTELPQLNCYEEELPGIVMGGWVRRFFSSEKIPLWKKDKLAKSLLNAKRAAAPISEEKQDKAILDHIANLTGKCYNPSPNEARHLGKVVDRVHDLVNEYYPTNFLESIPDWRLPSVSACIAGNRKNGGAHGRLAKKPLVSQRGKISQYGSLEVGNRSIPIFTMGLNIKESRKILETYCNEMVMCTASYQAILEPFKVRSITSSNAEIYQLGRLIQQPLHGFLRMTNGPFRFIGKRHNVEDIKDVYCGTLINTKASFDKEINLRIKKTMRTFFVAGDYKSATDNMHPLLPEIFILSLLTKTGLSGTIWEKVLKMTLGSHEILYPNKVAIKTTHGQLMGSPTSFPVLNIVNAAMFWHSCNLYYGYQMDWEQVLSEFRPLFNGDDISFASNPDHYKIWKEVCTGCGLSLSPGKNFCTPLFVNINSTNYSVEMTEINSEFSMVHNFEEEFVVNAGLIKGQAKVMNDTRRDDKKESEESLLSVCDQLEECVRVANDSERARCYELFEFHMSDKLKKSSRPWRLPRMFGGFGLPFGPMPTDAQFTVASNQLKNYKDLGDQKDKFRFNEYAIQYEDQLVKNIQNLEKQDRYPFEKDDTYGCSLEKVSTTIVRSYDMTQRVYEAPTLSICFLDARKVKKLDKDGKPRELEFNYKRALKKVSGRKCLRLTESERVDLLEYLSPTNFKLAPGGYTKEIRINVTKVQPMEEPLSTEIVAEIRAYCDEYNTLRKSPVSE